VYHTVMVSVLIQL